MACSCPLALSNASSLPEVALDCAVYFDSEDIESIRTTITRLYKDKDLRRTLSTKGDKRVKDFSWKKVAEETAEVYKSIIV